MIVVVLYGGDAHVMIDLSYNVMRYINDLILLLCALLITASICVMSTVSTQSRQRLDIE